jgi:hypothetical protein
VPARALPVRAHGQDLGHFVLVFRTESFGLGASVDVKHAAVLLADQLGMTLLRYRGPNRAGRCVPTIGLGRRTGGRSRVANVPGPPGLRPFVRASGSPMASPRANG